MIRDLGPVKGTQALGAEGAHGLAVLLVAALLAAGTMLPRSGANGPGFPPPRVVDTLDQAAARPPGIRADGGGRESSRPFGTDPAPSKPLVAAPLDLNTADAEALRGLPGVGPALAERIVSDRDARGPFRTPEDLLRVPGIGAKRWERIRPLVRATEAP